MLQLTGLTPGLTVLHRMIVRKRSPVTDAALQSLSAALAGVCKLISTFTLYQHIHFIKS